MSRSINLLSTKVASRSRKTTPKQTSRPAPDFIKVFSSSITWCCCSAREPAVPSPAATRPAWTGIPVAAAVYPVGEVEPKSFPSISLNFLSSRSRRESLAASRSVTVGPSDLFTAKPEQAFGRSAQPAMRIPRRTQAFDWMVRFRRSSPREQRKTAMRTTVQTEESSIA